MGYGMSKQLLLVIALVRDMAETGISNILTFQCPSIVGTEGLKEVD
jgi:hypothetical protein